MRADLKRDTGMWPDLWGPLCAIAAQRAGDPSAMDLLLELVEAGFCQPQLFDGKLEAACAADPRWPQALDGIALRVPPPRW